MEHEILQAFITEAESYLPTIRGGILVSLQSGRANGELKTSLMQVQTIKGAAMTAGMPEIAGIAQKLEVEIGSIAGERVFLTDDSARRLLDQVARIEQLLSEARLGTDEDVLFDFNDFIETSFENIQGGAAKAAEDADAAKEDSWDEEFEIDDEMLEIFALEAEDLLRNINTNLEILEKQPANREALMEIRRNAHTLKGSSGIVGLKKPSHLAHRVEDLLDYISDNEIESNERVFQLLLTSTDCLCSLTAGEDSPQINAKVERLYKDFDEIMLSLDVDSAFHTATHKQPAPAQLPEPARVNPPADNAVKIIAEEQRHIQNHKPVVRVSLERLDELVKIVSNLVVSRSAFDQKLSELDRQIEELHNSTRRLQRSTAKLETDFEADALNSRAAAFQPPELKTQTTATFAFSSGDLDFNAENSLLEFDSLEFDRYTDFHQTARELAETTNDTSAISSALDQMRGNLEILFDTQRRSIEDLQAKLLRIRMVSFDSLNVRLNRTVRATCEEEEGKQVDLLIEGGELEIDTQILDGFIEPLLHLIRNAVAHGIERADTRRLLGKPERGKINLKVSNESTHIVLTVTDDGRGISAAALKEKAVETKLITRRAADMMSDEEAFELIFLQGLTTADKLSQISGRGVGMNAVRTAVERQQGTISIASETQKGTTFTLRLPMSLSVTRALLIEANEQKFAFPLKLVGNVNEISAAQYEKARRDSFVQFGTVKYSLVHLNEILGYGAAAAGGEENVRLMLIETPENHFAVTVDKIFAPEEIVIKPLGSLLQNMPEMLGAAVLGDGGVVPVLNLFQLLKTRAANGVFHNAAADAAQTAKIAPVKSKPVKKVLIVDDSPSVRHLTSKLVKNAGFEAVIAKDGLEALDVLHAEKRLPDIILTDVEMPRMDGYELLSSLKREENFRQIPVVMITSRAGDKHRLKAFELGVSEYLIKPFEDSKLIETIRNNPPK